MEKIICEKMGVRDSQTALFLRVSDKDIIFCNKYYPRINRFSMCKDCLHKEHRRLETGFLVMDNDTANRLCEAISKYNEERCEPVVYLDYKDEPIGDMHVVRITKQTYRNRKFYKNSDKFTALDGFQLTSDGYPYPTHTLVVNVCGNDAALDSLPIVMHNSTFERFVTAVKEYNACMNK